MRSRVKKGLLISALLLAGLGAAGCGREGEGLSAAGQGETSAAGRLITVGFSQLGSESPTASLLSILLHGKTATTCCWKTPSRNRRIS